MEKTKQTKTQRDEMSPTDFITRINAMLTCDHRYHHNITPTLKLVGNYCQCERVQIIEIHPNRTFSISHEWHTPNVELVKNNFQYKKAFFDKGLEDQLSRDNYILVRHPDEITDDEELRNLFIETGTRSAIMLPLFISSNLFSFLLFSQCSSYRIWDEEEIRLMTNIASVVSGALESDLLIKKLMKHHQLYKEFIDNQLDFVLRLDKNFNILFANHKFGDYFHEKTGRLIGGSLPHMIPDINHYRTKLGTLPDFLGEYFTFDTTSFHEGQELTVSWCAYPIQNGENSREINLIGHDITKYKQNEKELSALKAQMAVFSDNLIPAWAGLKEILLKSNLEENVLQTDSIYFQVKAFDSLCKNIISQLDSKPLS